MSQTKLILRTYFDHEDFDGCDFAYVEINSDRAHQILNRMNLLHQAHNQDTELFEMHFWDWIGFFRYPNSEDEESGEIPDGFEDRLPASLMDNEAWTIMEPEFELPERLIERTECSFLVIYEFGNKDRPDQEIEWQTYPKHTNVHITTMRLNRKLIEQLAGS